MIAEQTWQLCKSGMMLDFTSQLKVSTAHVALLSRTRRRRKASMLHNRTEFDCRPNCTPRGTRHNHAFKRAKPETREHVAPTMESGRRAGWGNTPESLQRTLLENGWPEVQKSSTTILQQNTPACFFMAGLQSRQRVPKQRYQHTGKVALFHPSAPHQLVSYCYGHVHNMSPCVTSSHMARRREQVDVPNRHREITTSHD